MNARTKSLVSLDTTALTVFTQTISAYVEHKYSSFGLSGTDYNNAGQGKATHTGTAAVIRPTASDLVADVETAARVSLTEGEFAYFDTYYASSKLNAEPYGDMESEFERHLEFWPEHLRSAVASVDRRVRVKLGQALLDRSVAPLCDYFAAVDGRERNAEPDHLRAAERYGNAKIHSAVAA